MFLSTLLFAIFTSYGGLFFARSLQGFGSALADTAALGLVADRFTVDEERQRALGIALAFISFGSLVAPPFGGFFFQYFGHSVPFILLALMCFCDAILIGMIASKKAEEDIARENKPVGTPMWKLMSDPYIAIIAGALWFYGAVGLAFIAISTAFLPECRTYGQVTVPLGLMCFGIALVDTALLPTLAFIVDTRHASVYGSVYAIADISYSFAYALGPIVAGNIVEKFGFITLNLGMGAVSILYVPMLILLRGVYDRQVDKSERIGLIDQDELELNLESGGPSGGYGTANSGGAMDLPISSLEDSQPRHSLIQTSSEESFDGEY
ncbi:Oidioi.mRNA.OKI2018_I69.chr2.g5575.t1.cds [Oikopleura dioica]|uniref:Oidioi.mRNA.OKI2018_I69.chr2.g5575.t1.cds n=1 Tax=Oikopleura dioica TaxID=34765 RepID=A0ABN7T6N9_OIKDI|nr:Oidioi.mRNA.OKI2018_I69.chr2.g5575.t1.cds [Oikopleura dioica]